MTNFANNYSRSPALCYIVMYARTCNMIVWLASLSPIETTKSTKIILNWRKKSSPAARQLATTCATLPRCNVKQNAPQFFYAKMQCTACTVFFSAMHCIAFLECHQTVFTLVFILLLGKDLKFFEDMRLKCVWIVFLDKDCIILKWLPSSTHCILRWLLSLK